MTQQAKPKSDSADILNLLCSLKRVSDADIGQLLGIHGNSAGRKRRGGLRIHPEEMELLAVAFGVPIDLFDYEVIDAAKWLIEERPDWFSPRDPKPPTKLAEKRAEKLAAKLRDPAGVVQWNYTRLRAA